MLAQSFILFVIVTTSFRFSRVASVSHTLSDLDNDNDDINPYIAARQRLRQQQQLQHEAQNVQKNLEPLALSNTPRIQFTNQYYDDNDAPSPYNYKEQRRQRLQNELLSHHLDDEPHERNSATKANSKINSAEITLRRGKDDDGDVSESKMKPGLKEVSGNYQIVKHSINDDPDNNNKNAENIRQTNLLRHSLPTPSKEDNSAIAIGEEELDLELPYGIQNVRKRLVRHKPDHSKSITYQSLCPTKRIVIPLETSGYEYRPSDYVEVTCAHYTPANSYELRKNRICSEAGFSCIQLNRTIHLIRRNKASNNECWESEIRIVPSGCECMWPKHDNGDIATYHGAQKRFTGYANMRANADYEQGEGYRQIKLQPAEPFGTNGMERNENADGIGFEAFEYS